MSHDPDGDTKETAIKREVIADMRRWLLRLRALALVEGAQGEAIENFITNYERTQDWRP